MVENSLGRLWVEGHPNDELKSQWKYYLEEAEQEPDVQAQLAAIREEYKALKPEDILCIDPCSGSGHILAYMFDVLVQIYEAYGVDTRTAVTSIVENNIYGLDIDDRAAQLAYFSVMMKACQYDKRFLRRKVQPHVYAIVESNHVDPNVVDYFCNGDAKLKKAMDTIISELHDAKEYGSIITVSQQDWEALYARFDEIQNESVMSIYTDAALRLRSIVDIARTMAKKYNIVITNPPYMVMGNANAVLNEYVKKHFKESKADLYSVFIDKCANMTSPNYMIAMITQQSWMFLSSFEKLREKMNGATIVSMAHLGARAFEEIAGEVVQTTSFVRRNVRLMTYKGCYARLIAPTSQKAKEELFVSRTSLYYASQDKYSMIPGAPIAYWVNSAVFDAFEKYPNLASLCAVKNGMSTTDNNRFTRIWHECDFRKIGFNCASAEESVASKCKWFPYNKGGEYRKWYGNMGVVVNWQDNGKEIKKAAEGATGGRIVSQDYYFRRSVSWSKVSSGDFALRMYPQGFLFDVAGPGIFCDEEAQYYILALLNSKLNILFLKELYPTMNYEMGQVSSFPVKNDKVVIDEIVRLAKENVSLARIDWNNYENSWEFNRHPLIRKVSTIQEAFEIWEKECSEIKKRVKENEERINRLLLNLYGLDNTLSPSVDEEQVTIHFADQTKDIKSFISYAVGCMFRRYSLDEEGLVFAGGKFDRDRYKTFISDDDGIIPVCDDEYFEDDIVGLFVKFVKTVYGADTLDENLKFIADALGGKGQPKDVIRNYFMNDFYKDHCKMYRKRPIYWLFDSGKKNGFKALIYMHRYQPDTIARIRTDYVHEQQARYRTAIADLEQRIANASTRERVKLDKQLKTLNDQAAEIHTYEEKIHHLADQMISIDLDDGVKKNYAIFQDVLAKIK